MPRWTSFLLFFAVFLIVLTAIHAYLWMRLVRSTQLPPPWRAVLTATIVLAGISIPVVLIFFRGPAAPMLVKPLVWAAYIWLGTMFLLFVGCLAIDVVQVGAWLFRRLTDGAAPDDARRRFLARGFAGTVALTGGGLAAWGVRSAVGPVAVRRTEVPLARLKRQHDGLVIAQLTDLHIGPTIGRSQLQGIVDSTNALQADIVAITGDLVDGSVDELRDAVAPLAQLRARHGVFFVTGNHEYFSGAPQWVEEVSRLGIRVLRNERVEIDHNGELLDLAGVDDASAARFGHGHGEDLGRALADRAPDRTVVLLAHQPRTVRRSAAFGVDLQLSGHTHGGQIWPFGALVALQQVFLAGLHRQGDTRVYVSRGTGYWGPPMRLGAPAEISQLVLRSRAAAAT